MLPGIFLASCLISLAIGTSVGTIVALMPMAAGLAAGAQVNPALMAGIVFGNIVVWFIEKFIPWNFEFLAVSYLGSTVMLMGLQWIRQDQRTPDATDMVAQVLSRLPEGISLNPREMEVLTAILDNLPRKEIAARMNLSENTVKTHTRNLYKKLGVGNREELYAGLSS